MAFFFWLLICVDSRDQIINLLYVQSYQLPLLLARVPQMIKEVARVLTGGEDLPGFLRNHFVDLLNSIDRKMLHAEDTSLQQQALKRIEMLLK